MNKNNTSTSGLGLASVLTVIFVVLKLIGTINWSWWWVLSPIIIDVGLSIIVLIGLAIYMSHESKKYGYDSKKDKRDKWRFYKRDKWRF